MATILIVEDDADVVGLAKVALGIAGHDVVATAELARVVPLAAVARAEAVILDVNLPGFSGFDALGALRADVRTAGIPLLILSGLAAGADRVRGLTAGAHDYVAKPFVPLELVARVERLLQVGPRAGSATSGEDLADQLVELEAALAVDRPVSGCRLGRYEVSDRIGEGGMGVVLRGWDARLQRPVALKLLRAGTAPGEPSERVHRLLLEAILVAQVSHPNVVAVYDVGEAAGGGFVAMELVEGTTLEQRLEGGVRLPAAHAVPLASALLRGLAAAHRRRLVHHDVKPGNVLLGSDGAIKLTDFGVAELMSSWARDGDHVYGTPGYLAPEAIQGRGRDERSDVFAAGVVLYRCLAGRLPFTGPTIEATLVRTVYGQPGPLRPGTPDVMPELEAVVRSMLVADPDRRPGDAAALAEQLERIALRNAWRWDAAALAVPPVRPEPPAPTAPLRSRLMPALRPRSLWSV